MKVYQFGDTVFITCLHEVYSFSADTWTATNPDSGFPKITIIDPLGATKITAAGMSEAATGKWTYQYTLPASPEVGRWSGYIDVENGNYPDRQPFVFQVA